MKIICSWNNGNCNDINFKDFFSIITTIQSFDLVQFSRLCMFVPHTKYSSIQTSLPTTTLYIYVVAAKEKNTRHMFQTYSETRRD